jgi:hypothetical protein
MQTKSNGMTPFRGKVEKNNVGFIRPEFVVAATKAVLQRQNPLPALTSGAPFDGRPHEIMFLWRESGSWGERIVVFSA